MGLAIASIDNVVFTLSSISSSVSGKGSSGSPFLEHAHSADMTIRKAAKRVEIIFMAESFN